MKNVLNNSLISFLFTRYLTNLGGIICRKISGSDVIFITAKKAIYVFHKYAIDITNEPIKDNFHAVFISPPRFHLLIGM